MTDTPKRSQQSRVKSHLPALTSVQDGASDDDTVVPPTPATRALHHAVRHHKPVEVVKQALERTPHDIRQADDDGRLPLHIALLHCASPLVVELLLDAHPPAAGVCDGNGVLPLHMAVQARASAKIISALLRTHPASAESVNHLQRSPLAVACRLGAKPDVVRVLCEAYPEAAAKVDARTGNFPLHFYLQSRHAQEASPAVVKMLLRACPESVTHENSLGNLPLKIAVCWGAPLETIVPLVHAYPTAIDAIDKFGDTLVHAACANDADADVVDMLLEDSAELARRQNSRGQLPYHIALDYDASHAVRDRVLEAYPGAKDIPNPVVGGVPSIDGVVPPNLLRWESDRRMNKLAAGGAGTDDGRPPGCYCHCTIV